MILFPAIDLKDGKCVRLVQGRAEAKKVYSDDPASVAASFQAQGAGFLHVVDLDGAFTGAPFNLEAIRSIAEQVSIPFQVGGGLRTAESVKAALDGGAARAVVGTRAARNPDFVKELLDKFGADKIVLGLDVKGGAVAVEGWVETLPLPAEEFAGQMKNIGVQTVVYTDIARDGLLAGVNIPATRNLARVSGLRVIASGGVSSIEDIAALKKLQEDGVTGAIIGKAIYDGKLDLVQALRAAGG
ncbi:MAG: 1-(5-phosphoribosyl)-5-[(5-phosphoribosylamino)methylideneamino]imidazole-4-carboxamide isomerase [Syntrophomonadaceae bacterium]|nr:1-(5-phosphoribosyl)-5-[(5-phosphoribosylamino)methylideneamino]imidazole-4-carboxamide isomerase [Syntrophomonadaceae bacterium]